MQLACSLPHECLLRTWRGWRPDRGAELSFIPKEPNFVGSGLPHVGPWDYVQDVPMLWYGPGFIQAQGEVDRPVTLAGIAPTQGRHLRLHPFKLDRRSADVPRRSSPTRPDAAPPKLVVTMVWDAGGINTLEPHPTAWPYLKSLIPKGTFFTDATVGSSPTSTAQDHATIGTGAFPNHHGLVGHHFESAAR